MRRCESWDHLRVCGADLPLSLVVGPNSGSSPRVRSRPVQSVDEVGGDRIISACAEQTRSSRLATVRSRDHLRVCGADIRVLPARLPRQGSSPRVRSRRGQRRHHHPQPGIISACAEQTGRSDRRRPSGSDHLRVCGADYSPRSSHCFRKGSSPRVRSRRVHQWAASAGERIISACAEQTFSRWGIVLYYRDHLRVCGADQLNRAVHEADVGSSPRVRSRQSNFTPIRTASSRQNIRLRQ